MATIDELKKMRLAKLAKLRSIRIDPYPGTIIRKQTIAKARRLTGKDATAAVAGRVMGIRGHGKIFFLDLVDGTGKIQIVVKSDKCAAKSFALTSCMDLGDFLAVQGDVGKTQAGEVSVFAKTFQIISKAVRPLPDQWSGLKDIEERYRQRYVDLIVNSEVRDIFLMRSRIVTFLRAFLDGDGFIEVDTPVLQPLYGGALAKPFITHHNALDVDLYLRISDELYLKRLIIGGFDRVYEVGRDFRNEGIDRQHNPEFTMLEFYWAYADYEDLMKYTETMIASLVKELKGSYKCMYQGTELNFTPPWPRKTYRDIVLKYSGIDINKAKDEKLLLAAIKAKNITLDRTGVVGYGALLDTLFKATARSRIVGPMFLTDRPTAFVALAKRLPADPAKTASFQLLVAGRELINAYNELNDPEDQAARWKESEKLGKKGQSEHEAFDEDYIRALEYGMPPTAGWGLGIDNLVAVLTDQPNLKNVILFPTLRPEFA
jgi:lysyl-tRNA synthetase class 2